MPNEMPWQQSGNFWLDSAAARVKSVGLFFGSFNPIHNGHVALAQAILQKTALQQVWLVVSPQNPFKKATDLAEDRMRFEMVWLATRELPDIEACDIELQLPLPSYTIHTLEALSARYPHIEFTILMGADNWVNFDKWHRYEDILAKYNILIYPRQGSSIPEQLPEGVAATDTPLFNISATEVRNAVKNFEPIRHLVPEVVADYIRNNGLYR